jgi:hypothetical protein
LKFTFDDVKEPVTIKYASYVPGAWEAFRTHRYLGAAKQSLMNRARTYYGKGMKPGKILEMVDGVWYTLYDVKEGTLPNDVPWKKDVEKGGWRDKYVVRKSVPMTREEYAEWRIAVDREARSV